MTTPSQALIELQRIACDLNIAKLCADVLEDSRFPIWTASGSPHSHHYGKGGLVRHTLEVYQLCQAVNDVLGRPIDDVRLFVATLFHDCGKIYDYTHTDNTYQQWTTTVHKYAIHHVSRSVMIWRDAVRNTNLSYLEPEVTHAILAHHGRREWGSPVEPMTKLAWILHLCDSISARTDDCGSSK